MTCTILSDGNVKCWGKNSDGRLGLGDKGYNLGDDPGEMGDNLTTIELGTDRTAVKVTVSAGWNYAFTCALLDNGTVKCWGNGLNGKLGQGNTDTIGDGPGEMGDNLAAVDLGTGRTAIDIAVGLDHACAILDGEPGPTYAATYGQLKCWGKNSHGQLGQEHRNTIGDAGGEMGDNLPPIALGTNLFAVAVAAGFEFTCAIVADVTQIGATAGLVKCWGRTRYLGHDAVPLCSSSSYCSRWGDRAGQMGDNLPFSNLGTELTAVALATGAQNVCVLLNTGNVKCWGDADWAYLGLELGGWEGARGCGQPVAEQNCNPDMGDLLPPVNLGTGRTAQAIASGNGGYPGHICALLDDGSVKCWGTNYKGTLGHGTDGSDSGPPDNSIVGDEPGEMGDNLPAVDLRTNSTGRRSSHGYTVVAISTGPNHNIVLMSDGSVKCWGDNGNGALGLGHTDSLGDQPDELGFKLPAVQVVSPPGMTTSTTNPIPTTTSTPATTPSPSLVSRQCFEQGLVLGAECGAGGLQVRGCAASLAEFEAHVMQLGAGGSVAEAAASCSSFYSWMCAALGSGAVVM